MIARHQLPTHSELTTRALAAGALAVIGRDAAHAITEKISVKWSPRGILLTNSGTTALTLAITSALAKDGRPVALPAYACYDLVTAAAGAGARIVFYDVDPLTLAPDLESVHTALTFHPAALVLAPLYGIPVELNELRDLVDRSGCTLIEDAAQSVGAAVSGRPLGSFGSLSVLSFGRGKGLTGGAGGALLANDSTGAALLNAARAEIADYRRASGWSDWVRATAQFVLARPNVYALPAAIPFLKLGETVYRDPTDARPMTRAATAVLNQVWDASFAAAAERRRVAARLLISARTNGWHSPDVTPPSEAGYLRLPLVLTESANVVISRATARLGIMRGYPLPLPALPASAERCVNAHTKWPGASMLARGLITAPTHSRLNESDLLALESWLTTSGRASRTRDVPVTSASY